MNNDPEYFKQFEQLKVNNKNSLPISSNDSVNVDIVMKRDIELKQGYSSVEDNTTYDVVNINSFKNNFKSPYTINNNDKNCKTSIVPFTSRRDFMVNNSGTKKRTLELFTGTQSEYKNKQESEPLFDPACDISWVNGIPSITNSIQNRFIPSNKNNNGDLPFNHNMKIMPGINKNVQSGKYEVYRVNPLTVDEFRPYTKQKVSYANKPLEVVKLGEERPVNPNITKEKIIHFREQSFSDLLPTRSEINKNKITGEYTDLDTKRNIEERYNPGPGINTNMGITPDISDIIFKDSNKKSFSNDISHALYSKEYKPNFQNSKSYTAYINQRNIIQDNYDGLDFSNIANTSINGYTVNYNNKPNFTLRDIQKYDDISNIKFLSNATYTLSKDNNILPTIRELDENIDSTVGFHSNIKTTNLIPTQQSKSTIRQLTNNTDILNVNRSNQNGILYNKELLKQTLRPIISHNIILNASPYSKTSYTKYNDIAKKTMKETTLMQTPGTNIKCDNNSYTMIQDKLKTTIKETTSNNKRTGYINNADQKYYIKGINDIAKPTMKETTENNIITGNIINSSAGYLKFNDNAKTTIKETIEKNNIISNINNANTNFIPYINNSDVAKTTIKEQTLHNRSGNIYQNNNQYVNNNDAARRTVKETTLHQTPDGRVGMSTDIYVNNNDVAKCTKKQDTLYETPEGRLGLPNEMYITNNDVAKCTKKQDTLLLDYTGNITYDVKEIESRTASNNMQIDDRREILTYNRTPGGSKDNNGPMINRCNVKLNDKPTFEYVSNPNISLNRNIHLDTEYTKNAKIYIEENRLEEDIISLVLQNNPYIN